MPHHDVHGKPRRAAGFTLIELLLVLALLALLAGWAVPGFKTLAERNHLTAETMRLRTALSQARSLAVTQRRAVTLCPTQDRNECIDDWAAPLMLFRDAAQRGRRDATDGPIVQSWPASDAVTITYGGFGSTRYIRYRPTGMPRGQNGSYYLCTADGSRGQRLILSAQGRIRTERLSAATLDRCAAAAN